MKLIIKVLFLLCAVIIVLTSCSAVVDNVLKKADDKYLYLVAGFDDAAENTDVLLTLGYDKADRHMYVAQIPRDTYYNFGGSQNKINQLYATYRSRGDDSDTAMMKTANAIEELFGTEFDGYIGITTRTFREIVDAIGGLDINLENDLYIQLDDEEPVILSAGKNHIDGNMAEKFVRYRKGYSLGDLGRMDAQKIFINALFAKISEGVTLPALVSIAKSVSGSIVTDLNLTQMAAFIFANIRMGDGGKSSFVTMPGEATITENGLSYYVLNRKSAVEVAKKYMFSQSEFDSDRKCLDKSDVSFVNIYEDDKMSVKEYSSDNIADIHITTS